MKKNILVITLILTLTHTVYSDWEELNFPSEELAFLIQSGMGLFAGTLGDGIFFSSDDGNTWVPRNNGITDMNVSALHSTSSYVYAASLNGIYRTSNNGISWILLVPPLSNDYVSDFNSNASYIFASTYDGYVYRSINNGVTWQLKSNGLAVLNIYSLTRSGNNLFAGSSSGVYRSTNEGDSWFAANNGMHPYVTSIAASGSIIYAGTYGGGVYRSVNSGSSWTPVNNGLTSNLIRIINFSGSNIFAGTNNGVYISTNSSHSWFLRNEGFATANTVRALLVSSNFIFVVIENGNSYSVWRRLLNEVISVKNISSDIPQNYSLYQNYPNPFNPTTMIRFQIPVSGLVKLTVYDAIGKEINTLVNERLIAGIYESEWDASNFTSGVYYYRITAEGFSETKKMIVLK